MLIIVAVALADCNHVRTPKKIGGRQKYKNKTTL